jgi:hypothetical protein
MIETPIFLVGAERSGTTLLRLMLDYHPQLAFQYEFEFAVDQISYDGNYPQLSDYYEYLAYHRIFLSTGFTIERDLDYPSLVNSFLLQKQRRSHKPFIGATVHHRFDQLLKIWPKAKFIHLLRDGRDVAHSSIVMGWSGNLFTAADLWIEAEQLWQKLSPQIPADRQITVYYEKLVQNSDEVLTQLCDFIGIPFDKAMYDYAQHTTYDLPNPKIAEQWRRKLTNKQIQLAESKMATLLTERGYELSGLPLLKITPWHRWQLAVQNRWAKNTFRLRRYSLGLYLADVLSRRLHLNHWQKQVRLRINELEKKHLK